MIAYEMNFGDSTIRPNQIYAVSLRHSPLTQDQQAGVWSA